MLEREQRIAPETVERRLSGPSEAGLEMSSAGDRKHQSARTRADILKVRIGWFAEVGARAESGFLAFASGNNH